MQNIKKLKGDTLVKSFFEKSHNADKNLKGDRLGFFNIYSVAKHQIVEGRTLWGNFVLKKNLTMSKKLKWGHFSLSRYCMLRGKNAKNYNITIWDHEISKNVQELFWSVRVDWKRTKKSHYNSLKRRLKLQYI